jgi:hypothetical protein
MDPDDLRASLAFIVSQYPQMFDLALACDLELAERLQERLDHQHDDDPEPYCTTCGAKAGIFIAHGDAWLHYTGEGTVTSPVELFDAGHAPVIAWRARPQVRARPAAKARVPCMRRQPYRRARCGRLRGLRPDRGRPVSAELAAPPPKPSSATT